MPLFGRGASGITGIPLFGRGASGMTGMPLFGRGASGITGMPLAKEIAISVAAIAMTVITSERKRFAVLDIANPPDSLIGWGKG